MWPEGIITELQHIQWVSQSVWIVGSRHGPRSRPPWSIRQMEVERRSGWGISRAIAPIGFFPLAVSSTPSWKILGFFQPRVWRMTKKRTLNLEKYKTYLAMCSFIIFIQSYLNKWGAFGSAEWCKWHPSPRVSCLELHYQIPNSREHIDKMSK